MSVKTPRFSGPFKWSALRQQLLSLRDDVHTIRKVAGRNVTIDEHRGIGKVINARRDRQVPAPMECAGCALPAGDCPHAFCLEFKLDSDDTSNRDIFELNSVSGPFGSQLGFYYDLAGHWTIYGAGTDDQLTIDAVNPYDVWHAVSLQITRLDDTDITVSMTVDGVTASQVFHWGDCDPTTNIQLGGMQGDSNPMHRSIRCVSALGNPSRVESNFSFPSDSFDSLFGDATIDGDGFLRIDSDTDSYGLKALAYQMTCSCCGLRDCTEVSTITFSASVSGSASNACGCTYSGSYSDEISFTRIDHDVDFTPGTNQFKLWFAPREGDPAHCDLNILINGPGGISFGDTQGCGSCYRFCNEDYSMFKSNSVATMSITITNFSDGGGTINFSIDANVDMSCVDCPHEPGHVPYNCGRAFSTGAITNSISFVQERVSGGGASGSDSETFTGQCKYTGSGEPGCSCSDSCDPEVDTQCSQMADCTELCQECAYHSEASASITLA